MNTLPSGEHAGERGLQPYFVFDPQIAESATTGDEAIRSYYDQLGLDDLFRKFAFAESLSDENPYVVDEPMVAGALLVFSVATTYVATGKETRQLDIELVKDAFDHVYNGMDIATEAKLGPFSAPPAGILQRLLGKTGARPPVGQHISRLGDEYWYEQFPREQASGIYVKRQPGDSDAMFAARGIHRTMRGFLLGPFSHLQQADRYA